MVTLEIAGQRREQKGSLQLSWRPSLVVGSTSAEKREVPCTSGVHGSQQVLGKEERYRNYFKVDISLLGETLD